MFEGDSFSFPFDSVNINNYCLVEPNDAVIKTYQRYMDQFRQRWNQLGLSGLKLPIRPEGVQLAIHELMEIYGPLFAEDYKKPPFTTVTLFLNTTEPSSTDPLAARTIGVYDFVFLRLSEAGARKVSGALPGRSASRVPGDLTSIQFGTVAYLFGPKKVNNGYPDIVDNQLYIPQKRTLDYEVG